MNGLAALSLQNFRDASGAAAGTASEPYAAAGGARMEPGIVFRSDNAIALHAHDAATLERLELGRAFDLRSASERRRVPSVFARLESGPDVTAFEDLTSFNEGELAVRLMTTLVERADVAGLMELYYRQLPAVFARPLATFFAHVADDDRPVVVHCRGGKDRTGFVVAMLHRAIGVSADDALADYLASAGLFHPGPEEDAMLAGIERRTGVRLEPETLAPMMTVAPAYLDAAYAAIEERYGDVDRYLSDACDLDAERRARLTARLTRSTRGAAP